ncbi:hypothetical protein CVT25_015352 [Psilocybe cyanescens]|uniref:DUF7770 domain-containing protein n=1 Tax=Psilocybe cyanescens TaxID=93625 RepID=A0A409WH46_PSICY|nr:hypothetical protein CVT25_015352 [Psilocybe cyanescens]
MSQNSASTHSVISKPINLNPAQPNLRPITHMSQNAFNIHNVISESIDISQVDPAHRELPITDVNLCAYLDKQGSCDECHNPPKWKTNFDLETDMPPANHYALWFGFGAGCRVHVGIDVLPEKGSGLTRNARAVVLLASKTVPTDENIGCVMRELNVKPGTTINTIIALIQRKNMHKYQFRLKRNNKKKVKQQAGCRLWIYQLSGELENVGIVGPGFQADVWEFLHVYFARKQTCSVSDDGKFIPAMTWGPHWQRVCAPVEDGSLTVGVEDKNRVE